MPKFKTLQGNFSAGVLSPQALGRVDIARYPNGAKRLRNVIVRSLGGVQKRYGTQYIAATKDSTKQSRLIPYIINKDTGYMLEVGDLYLRVFKSDGTQVAGPYEVVTPWTIAQVLQMDYSQGEDSMYVFHRDVYPNRIRRFADANWNVAVAPFSTLPFAEIGEYYAVGLTLSSNTVGTGRTMTAGSAVFLTADVGRAITWNGGLAVITGFTSTTVVTVEVKIIFDSATITSGLWNIDSSPQTTLTPSAASPEGASTSLTLSADGWRASDVGKFVRINGGLVRITGYTSALIATGTIQRVLTSTVAAPSLSWTLEGSVWSAGSGYPRTGTFFQQRLMTAGTLKNPQTIWASKTGEPLEFMLGTVDDDGFSYTIAGDDNQINQINYLIAARNLIALTFGGEFSINGGVEKAITPTNIQITPQTPHGSDDTVRPVQVRKETLFAQRVGRKLRAMGYALNDDGYKAPDLATLSEHITESGIGTMAFQQEPEPIVWIALNSGRLVSMTIDRDIEMLAWTDHETDGAVESIAILPTDSADQVWMVVRRSVNGATVRYVERMNPDFYPIYGTAIPSSTVYPPGDYPVNWGYTLDCAKTADFAAGQATWTGFDHLEGKTVRCLADGVDMPAMVVTGGSITLPRTAKRILVGLMFKPSIVMLTPEIQTGTGSMQADALSTSEVVIRMNNTIGATVNGDVILPGRVFGADVLDAAPVLFTGDKAISTLGWSKGKAEITISQDDPFPFHLLAVIRTITSNQG